MEQGWEPGIDIESLIDIYAYDNCDVHMWMEMFSLSRASKTDTSAFFDALSVLTISISIYTQFLECTLLYLYHES